MPQFLFHAGRTDGDISLPNATVVDIDFNRFPNGGSLGGFPTVPPLPRDIPQNRPYILVPSGVTEGGQWFYIEAAVSFAANPCGSRGLNIWRDQPNVGSYAECAVWSPAAPGIAETRLHVAKLVRLNPGDRIRVQAYQNSGTALNMKCVAGPNFYYSPYVSLYSV